MKNITLSFVFILMFIISYGQKDDYVAGRFYLQPLGESKQIQTVEAYNEEFKIYEDRKICREMIWERKKHEGFVWIPNHADGTWYTVERELDFFWTFQWTDWKFCDEK